MAVQALGLAATSKAAPSLASATAGVCINGLGPCDQATVLIESTAGSGTMTATVKIWGYHQERGKWYVLGTLNAAAAIGETTANAINYAELLVGLRRFSRLDYEIVSLGGTDTAINVHIDTIRASAGSR